MCKKCSAKRFTVIFLVVAVFSSLGLATSAPAPKRHKVIDFEDELVEGVNKRPLDAFQQISDQKKKLKKMHLYHKRASFGFEVDQTLKEMGYTQ